MQLIKVFKDISMTDIDLVGEKSASLGEMVGSLSGLGVKVPNGFAITTEAFRYFLKHNELNQIISKQLNGLDFKDIDALTYAGGKIRASIIHSQMPDDLSQAITCAYETLENQYGSKPDVAVRCSTTTGDLHAPSLTGQQDSYLNVAGTRNLIATCKLVFASLYTDRAISYREQNSIEHSDVALSIAVQKMVRSDQSSAGVIFTLDSESGFRDVVLVTSSYGLGENIVQGAVNPDEFYVFKTTLNKGFKPLIKKHLGSKEIKMIYAPEQLAGVYTKNVPVQPSERCQFSLSDEETLSLARYATIIEDHYSKHESKPCPMDIEWAKDGYTGELFIVQARPGTVGDRAKSTTYETFQLREHSNPIITGRSVGRRIATGKIRVILDTAHMSDLQDGEILVTDKTNPDWDPVLRRAAAIITNRGGRTCHAAIIAREMGIPALVGCNDATECVGDGEKVTVSCAGGDTGHVYPGILPFDVRKIPTDIQHTTQTKIYLNLGNPEQAMQASFLPADGVGLARLEFIISNTIKVHPSAILQIDSLDKQTQHDIQDVIAGYDTPRRFFIDKLAQGIGMIAAAFYPKPVVVRLSDFKSNEYALLIGGKQFEPKEENPTLGMRGARRYFSEAFSECFEMECKAISKVQKDMGLDNIQLLVPFVRSPKEAANVAELLARNGLKRTTNGLKIFLMCEIPSNALLADEFLEHFDGFSIGSNDLSQLTLGIDREAGLYYELDGRNEATQKLISMAISACKEVGKTIGICGQAPSDFKSFVKYLIHEEIDSISLNQDSLLDMKAYISNLENR